MYFILKKTQFYWANSTKNQPFLTLGFSGLHHPHHHLHLLLKCPPHHIGLLH